MTRAEWWAEYEKNLPNASGTGGASRWITTRGAVSASGRLAFLRMNLPDIDMGEGLMRGARHRDVIEAALRMGKPVPARVLEDYPELGPQTICEDEEGEGKAE